MIDNSMTAKHTDKRLVIPSAIKPSDGRFGCGPSKVPTSTIQTLADQAITYMGTSHRRDTVRNTVRDIRNGISELLQLPADYEVILGNGGATAFWDAASFGLIEHRSHHLSFGEFGSKFVAVTTSAPHLEDPSVAEADAGSCPPLDCPPPDDRAYGVDAYCYPQNETSTGVSIEPKRPNLQQTNSTTRPNLQHNANQPQPHGATQPLNTFDPLVIVDATSAACAVKFNPLATDVYYFSPQKALASDGGIWIAALSPSAVERIERLNRSHRWTPAFLDLHIALQNSRKNQTYNTPALATLFMAAQQVAWFNENGGLDWSANLCDTSSQILYGWAERSKFANPFVADATIRSKTTGTIDFNSQLQASTVCRILRDNGIVDTESYRKLNRNQIRVAMFPSIKPDDVEALTACIDYIAEKVIA